MMWVVDGDIEERRGKRGRWPSLSWGCMVGGGRIGARPQAQNTLRWGCEASRNLHLTTIKCSQIVSHRLFKYTILAIIGGQLHRCGYGYVRTCHMVMVRDPLMLLCLTSSFVTLIGLGAEQPVTYIMQAPPCLVASQSPSVLFVCLFVFSLHPLA